MANTEDAFASTIPDSIMITDSMSVKDSGDNFMFFPSRDSFSSRDPLPVASSLWKGPFGHGDIGSEIRYRSVAASGRSGDVAPGFFCPGSTTPPSSGTPPAWGGLAIPVIEQ